MNYLLWKMKLYNIIALLSLGEKILNWANQRMIHCIWIIDKYHIIEVIVI